MTVTIPAVLKRQAYPRISDESVLEDETERKDKGGETLGWWLLS